MDWAPAPFNNGWMGRTKVMLHTAGLLEDWKDPSLCCVQTKGEWKDKVYKSVESRETEATIERLSKLTSGYAARYLRCKFWGIIDEDVAYSVGDIGRRGALTPEPYLNDRREPVGRRLKLMCRAGCLPILKRVVREADLPACYGVCKLCSRGKWKTLST